MTWFAVFAYFWPFFEQKVQNNMGKEWFYQKINAIYGLTTLYEQGLIRVPISFHYVRKNFLAIEKHCTHIVSVM